MTMQRSRADRVITPAVDRELSQLAARHNRRASLGQLATLPMLRAVYRRGVDSQPRTPATSRHALAMRRVQEFTQSLTLPRSPRLADLDLMPAPVPRSLLAEAIGLADSHGADEVLSLLTASAFSRDAERQFNLARALALASSAPALDLALGSRLRALVADGNSSLARSLRARKQLRDRHGQWIEMGGGIRFKVKLPGAPGGGTWYHGTVVSQDVPNGRVNVKLDDGHLVNVPASKVEKTLATLPEPNALTPGGTAPVNLVQQADALHGQIQRLDSERRFARDGGARNLQRGEQLASLKQQHDELRNRIADQVLGADEAQRLRDDIARRDAHELELQAQYRAAQGDEAKQRQLVDEMNANRDAISEAAAQLHQAAQHPEVDAPDIPEADVKAHPDGAPPPANAGEPPSDREVAAAASDAVDELEARVGDDASDAAKRARDAGSKGLLDNVKKMRAGSITPVETKRAIRDDATTFDAAVSSAPGMSDAERDHLRSFAEDMADIAAAIDAPDVAEARLPETPPPAAPETPTPQTGSELDDLLRQARDLAGSQPEDTPIRDNADTVANVVENVNNHLKAGDITPSQAHDLLDTASRHIDAVIDELKPDQAVEDDLVSLQQEIDSAGGRLLRGGQSPRLNPPTERGVPLGVPVSDESRREMERQDQEAFDRANRPQGGSPDERPAPRERALPPVSDEQRRAVDDQMREEFDRAQRQRANPNDAIREEARRWEEEHRLTPNPDGREIGLLRGREDQPAPAAPEPPAPNVGLFPDRPAQDPNLSRIENRRIQDEWVDAKYKAAFKEYADNLEPYRSGIETELGPELTQAAFDLLNGDNNALEPFPFRDRTLVVDTVANTLTEIDVAGELNLSPNARGVFELDGGPRFILNYRAQTPPVAADDPGPFPTSPWGHEQAVARFPDGDRGIIVDDGMAPILEPAWKLGFNTYASDMGHASGPQADRAPNGFTFAWLSFNAPDEATRFAQAAGLDARQLAPGEKLDDHMSELLHPGDKALVNATDTAVYWHPDSNPRVVQSLNERAAATPAAPEPQQPPLTSPVTVGMATFTGHEPGAGEIAALTNYGFNAHFGVNSSLRDPANAGDFGEAGQKLFGDMTESMKDLLSRSRLDSDQIVYRGIVIEDAALRRRFTREGSVITDDGFTSTTADEFEAIGFTEIWGGGGQARNIMMEITVPAGANALDMDALLERYAPEARAQGLGGESEILLPPGGQFRVDSSYKDEGHWVVSTTYLGNTNQGDLDARAANAPRPYSAPPPEPVPDAGPEPTGELTGRGDGTFQGEAAFWRHRSLAYVPFRDLVEGLKVYQGVAGSDGHINLKPGTVNGTPEGRLGFETLPVAFDDGTTGVVDRANLFRALTAEEQPATPEPPAPNVDAPSPYGPAPDGVDQAAWDAANDNSLQGLDPAGEDRAIFDRVAGEAGVSRDDLVEAARALERAAPSVPDYSGLSRVDPTKLALDYYVGQGFDTINGDLRAGRPIANQEYVDAIDALIDGSPLAEDTTLYRAVVPNEAEGYQQFVESLQPGAVVEDKGYVSTTRDRATADEFFSVEMVGDGNGYEVEVPTDQPRVMFQINAPAGAKGLDIDPLVPDLQQSETLLPRGSKIRVNDVNRDGDGNLHVTADLVTDNAVTPSVETPNVPDQHLQPVPDASPAADAAVQEFAQQVQDLNDDLDTAIDELIGPADRQEAIRAQLRFNDAWSDYQNGLVDRELLQRAIIGVQPFIDRQFGTPDNLPAERPLDISPDVVPEPPLTPTDPLQQLVSDSLDVGDLHDTDAELLQQLLRGSNSGVADAPQITKDRLRLWLQDQQGKEDKPQEVLDALARAESLLHPAAAADHDQFEQPVPAGFTRVEAPAVPDLMTGAQAELWDAPAGDPELRVWAVRANRRGHTTDGESIGQGDPVYVIRDKRSRAAVGNYKSWDAVSQAVDRLRSGDAAPSAETDAEAQARQEADRAEQARADAADRAGRNVDDHDRPLPDGWQREVTDTGDTVFRGPGSFIAMEDAAGGLALMRREGGDLLFVGAFDSWPALADGIDVNRDDMARQQRQQAANTLDRLGQADLASRARTVASAQAVRDAVTQSGWFQQLEAAASDAQGADALNRDQARALQDYRAVQGALRGLQDVQAPARAPTPAPAPPADDIARRVGDVIDDQEARDAFAAWLGGDDAALRSLDSDQVTEVADAVEVVRAHPGNSPEMDQALSRVLDDLENVARPAPPETPTAGESTQANLAVGEVVRRTRDQVTRDAFQRWVVGDANALDDLSPAQFEDLLSGIEAANSDATDQGLRNSYGQMYSDVVSAMEEQAWQARDALAPEEVPAPAPAQRADNMLRELISALPQGDLRRELEDVLGAEDLDLQIERLESIRRRYSGADPHKVDKVDKVLQQAKAEAGYPPEAEAPAAPEAQPAPEFSPQHATSLLDDVVQDLQTIAQQRNAEGDAEFRSRVQQLADNLEDAQVDPDMQWDMIADEVSNVLAYARDHGYVSDFEAVGSIESAANYMRGGPEEPATPPAVEAPAPEPPAAPAPVQPLPGANLPGYHADNVHLYQNGLELRAGSRVSDAGANIGTVVSVQNQPPYVRIRFDDGRVLVRSARTLNVLRPVEVPGFNAPEAPAAPEAPQIPDAARANYGYNGRPVEVGDRVRVEDPGRIAERGVIWVVDGFVPTGDNQRLDRHGVPLAHAGNGWAVMLSNEADPAQVRRISTPQQWAVDVRPAPGTPTPTPDAPVTPEPTPAPPAPASEDPRDAWVGILNQGVENGDISEAQADALDNWNEGQDGALDGLARRDLDNLVEFLHESAANAPEGSQLAEMFGGMADALDRQGNRVDLNSAVDRAGAEIGTGDEIQRQEENVDLATWEQDLQDIGELLQPVGDVAPIRQDLIDSVREWAASIPRDFGRQGGDDMARRYSNSGFAARDALGALDRGDLDQARVALDRVSFLLRGNNYASDESRAWVADLKADVLRVQQGRPVDAAGPPSSPDEALVPSRERFAQALTDLNDWIGNAAGTDPTAVMVRDGMEALLERMDSGDPVDSADVADLTQRARAIVDANVPAAPEVPAAPAPPQRWSLDQNQLLRQLREEFPQRVGGARAGLQVNLRQAGFAIQFAVHADRRNDFARRDNEIARARSILVGNRRTEQLQRLDAIFGGAPAAPAAPAGNGIPRDDLLQRLNAVLEMHAQGQQAGYSPIPGNLSAKQALEGLVQTLDAGDPVDVRDAAVRALSQAVEGYQSALLDARATGALRTATETRLRSAQAILSDLNARGVAAPGVEVPGVVDRAGKPTFLPRHWLDVPAPNVGERGLDDQAPGVQDPYAHNVHLQAPAPEAVPSDYLPWTARAGEVAAAARSRVSFAALWDESVDRNERRAMLAQAFGDYRGDAPVTFGSEGYRVQVDTLDAYDGYWHASGRILDQNGATLGSFSRSYNRDSNSVSNNSMGFQSQATKGAGFATAFNRHLENWYIANGVDTVRVSAAGGGGYTGGRAWALNGFNWTGSVSSQISAARGALNAVAREAGTPGELAAVKDLKARLRLVENDNSLANDILPTPMELALVGWRPGLKSFAGSKAMARHSWGGTKHLTPSAREYRQYEAKRVARGAEVGLSNSPKAPQLSDAFLQQLASTSFDDPYLQDARSALASSLARRDRLGSIPQELQRKLAGHMALAISDKRTRRALGGDEVFPDIIALHRALLDEEHRRYPDAPLPEIARPLLAASALDLRNNSVEGFDSFDLGFGAGVHTTYKVTHQATGQVFYVKAESTAGRQSEADFNRLFREAAMRGVPEFAPHETDNELIVMQNIGDNVDLVQRPMRSGDIAVQYLATQMADPGQLIGMWVSDIVAGNTDRHQMNLLVGEDHNSRWWLFPVDQGYGGDNIGPRGGGFAGINGRNGITGVISSIRRNDAYRSLNVLRREMGPEQFRAYVLDWITRYRAALENGQSSGYSRSFVRNFINNLAVLEAGIDSVVP